MRFTSPSETQARVANLVERAFIFTFLGTMVMVAAMHLLPAPALEVWRAPSDLRHIAPLWGLSWPLAFDVYHVFLALLFGTGALTVAGLRRFTKQGVSGVCRLSALLGFLTAGTVFLYFFLQLPSDRPFPDQAVDSAVIFSLYALLLLVLHSTALLVTIDWPQRLGYGQRQTE